MNLRISLYTLPNGESWATIAHLVSYRGTNPKLKDNLTEVGSFIGRVELVESDHVLQCNQSKVVRRVAGGYLDGMVITKSGVSKRALLHDATLNMRMEVDGDVIHGEDRAAPIPLSVLMSRQ